MEFEHIQTECSHAEPDLDTPAISDEGDAKLLTKGGGRCTCELEDNIVWGSEPPTNALGLED